MAAQRQRRRVKGTGTITFDTTAQRWIGVLELGHGADGRPVRTKVRGKTRDEVNTKLEQLRAQREAGVEIVARTTTFSEIAEVWLERGLPNDLTENTRANYERILRINVEPTLGTMRVTGIRSEHVEAMLDAMADADKSAATMRHALNLTRRVLRFAMTRDIVTRNVAEPVQPRRGPRAERHGLTPKQARRLLKVAREDRLGNLLTLSLLLGLRPGEAAGLTWKHVKLEGSDPTITIAASLRRQPDGQMVLAEPKTTSSRRRLRLPAQAVDALHRQKTSQDADRMAAGKAWTNKLGLVFTTEVGTPLDPSNVRRSMSNMAKRANIEHLHPHLLRHAAASLLSAAGVPIEDISDTLGHRSITVTAEIYRHPIAPVRSGHVAAMDAITSGTKKPAGPTA